MEPDVIASAMFPSESSTPTRTAFTPPGPSASRSPTSSLLCGPPTPSSPSTAAPVVPRGDLPRPAWRWRVSQVPGPSSCARATIPNPVRNANLSPTRSRSALLPSSYHAPSAPETIRISGPTHAAHALACLRIAEPVSESVARLATGLPGSALAGSVSHPQDDSRDFQKRCFAPFLLDQPCLVTRDSRPSRSPSSPTRRTPARRSARAPRS